MRLLTLFAGIGAALVVSFLLWVDEGEVVTLVTRDVEGMRIETPLWIVESDEGLYLRAAFPQMAWVERIRARPEVELSRNGETSEFIAKPIDDPSVRDVVGRAMAEKYGRVDRVFGWLLDYSQAVPVLLVPIPTESPELLGDASDRRG